jgi:thioredoxin 1
MMGEVKAVSDTNFDEAISADEWVLVDFWAPWCGPCKALGPILEQVAAESPVTIAKVNTDSDSMNAARLGVRGIPALFLFHNGKMVANQAGMVPKPKLMDWLNKHMSANDF